MLLELHRCRRYYERPESQQEYQASAPGPHSYRPNAPRARSEFHERCAAVGDHSELLRRLGLVVDLRVADPAAAAAAHSGWPRTMSLDGDCAPVPQCRRCVVTRAGDALVSAPAGNDWPDGALRLGDAQRFAVLTLDTDGSALKAERFLWTLPRLLRTSRTATRSMPPRRRCARRASPWRPRSRRW